MEKNKKHLIIFCISLLASFIFWRLLVILKAGEISILRDITGLNIHHYHYGILIIFIAVLFFIFRHPEKYSIALTGIGFGTYFDGFLSRLFSSSSRYQEVTNYSNLFFPTLLLLAILCLIAGGFYILFREKT